MTPVRYGGGAVAAPSDSDQTISVGTLTDTFPSTFLALAGAQSVGQATYSLDQQGNLVLSVGTETLSGPELVSDLGNAAQSVGTKMLSGPTPNDVGSAAQATGTKTLSAWTASSSILGRKYAGTATAVSRGGTVDWVNPSNAAGAPDGALASITVSAASDVIADDLKLTGYNIPAISSGFTRTKVELIIRHLWDSTGQLLETCSFRVELRKSDDTLVTTAKTITEATASQATALIETFNLTTATAGLTDAEIQGLQTWCSADATLLTVLQGNFSWSIDYCHLRVTYTRSGIT